MNRKVSPAWLNSSNYIIIQTRSVVESGRRDLHRLSAALAQCNGTCKASLALIALPRISPDPAGFSGVEGAMEDRNHLEQQLALAEEHIAKIGRLVARQRKLVEELEHNHPYISPNARALLAEYEEFHAMLASERVRLL